MQLKNGTSFALQQTATTTTTTHVRDAEEATVAGALLTNEMRQFPVLRSTRNKHNKPLHSEDEVPVPTTTATSISTTTPYRENADMIFPFHVDVRCNDHIVLVATTLCPDLLATKRDSACINSCLIPSSNALASTNNDDHLSIEHITVRPLTGGLSNALFIVENVLTHVQALVRINPTHTNPNIPDIVERGDENQLAAWLSTTGDAPIYYGQFENGRVEEFYDSHITLNRGQMNCYAPDVAILLASFHSKQPPYNRLSPLSSRGGGSIWDRGDMWLQMAQKDGSIQPTTTQAEHSNLNAFLQELEQEWAWLKLNLLSRIVEVNSTTINDDLICCNSKELPVDQSYCNRLARRFCAQIVLAHMDCQSLNILIPASESATTLSIDHEHEHEHDQDYNEDIESNDDCDTSSASGCSMSDNSSSEDDNSLDTETDAAATAQRTAPKLVNDTKQSTHLRLIDYEYSGYNPRGADIANTFCEYCDMNNIRADYEKEYPSDDIQDAFLSSYVNSTLHFLESKSSSTTPNGTSSNEIVHLVQQLWNSTDAPENIATSVNNKNMFLSAVKNEIGQYTLISHLTWTIWSIVQAKNPSVLGFDYVAYAKQRMAGYYYFRQRYWKV